MCKPVVFRGSRHVGAELEPGVSARRGRCGARVVRLWGRGGVVAGGWIGMLGGGMFAAWNRGFRRYESAMG